MRWRRINFFHYRVKKPASRDSGVLLRQEFPFLSDPDCPLELQAIVTRKITQYHRYHDEWAQLFTCGSLDECAKISSLVISSYLDNRKIYDELYYYQLNHKILGRHPIFKEFRSHRKLIAMSIRELIERERRVKNNIWRVKSEIEKNDKPELDDVRRDRLSQYENELSEIKRLLDEDERK